MFRKEPQVHKSRKGLLACEWYSRGGYRIFKRNFIVQDTGIEISEEAIAKLFDPFSQAVTFTAKIHGGTGLELTVCRDLLRFVGGETSLKSTSSEGTILTCSIPFARQASSIDSRHFPVIFSAKPTSAESSFDPSSSQSKDNPPQAAKDWRFHIPEALTTMAPKRLILIVDENAINRKIVSLYATKFGYDAAVACDKQEACDYVGKSSSKPRPDLVFMDCIMPVVTDTKRHEGYGLMQRHSMNIRAHFLSSRSQQALGKATERGARTERN